MPENTSQLSANELSEFQNSTARTEIPGSLVVAGAEHGILEIVGVAHNGLEAFLGKNSNAINPTADPQSSVGPALSQQGDVGTGHNAALGIDDAEGSVGNIL